MAQIDISNLDKAAVLAALYNGSRPQGLGVLHFDPTPMTTEEARSLVEKRTYFDYLNGRVLKMNLAGDTLDPRLYDRDLGEGAAERALSKLVRKAA